MDSDVVARATVPAQRPSATPIGTNGEIQYTVGLQGVHILATKASTASPPEITSIVADDNGDPTTRDLKPGAYILFLSEGPSGDYYSTNGMLGEFPINAAQTVARECPHYGDPTHPITATSTQPNLASFLAQIPPTLPPHAASPLPSAPSS